MSTYFDTTNYPTMVIIIRIKHSLKIRKTNNSNIIIRDEMGSHIVMATLWDLLTAAIYWEHLQTVYMYSLLKFADQNVYLFINQFPTYLCVSIFFGALLNSAGNHRLKLTGDNKFVSYLLCARRVCVKCYELLNRRHVFRVHENKEPQNKNWKCQMLGKTEWFYSILAMGTPSVNIT